MHPPNGPILDALFERRMNGPLAASARMRRYQAKVRRAMEL
jgi:hypothetical protein